MRLAKIGWTPDNLFFRGVKLAFVNTQAWRNWEDTMRSLKLALACACALGLLSAGTANSAEPVKIRMSWVAPLANWGSIVLEKKDLAQHLGKSYTLESIHYQGTPQTITAIANNELESPASPIPRSPSRSKTPGSTTSASLPMNFRMACPATTAGSFTCARTAASTRSRTSRAR